MASIAELCWTAAEDLFRDLDLDELYARQIEALGLCCNRNYPYTVVVFTGRITIGISLGNTLADDMRTGKFLGRCSRPHGGQSFLAGLPTKEPSE